MSPTFVQHFLLNALHKSPFFRRPQFLTVFLQSRHNPDNCVHSWHYWNCDGHRSSDQASRSGVLFRFADRVGSLWYPLSAHQSRHVRIAQIMVGKHPRLPNLVSCNSLYENSNWNEARMRLFLYESSRKKVSKSSCSPSFVKGIRAYRKIK